MTYFQFSPADYATIHHLCFSTESAYPGYKPEVIEIPNGDGKADAAKRYAHVALKYLPGWGSSSARTFMVECLVKAHALAERVARELEVPKAFLPDLRFGALRVLEYPPGADSAAHQDFDLFTLHLYRTQDQCFWRGRGGIGSNAARALNPGLHIGQLGEAVGLGPACEHGVDPCTEPQHAIVYFAIPDHDAMLPEGLTVKGWLNERMARSRTEFKAYK